MDIIYYNHYSQIANSWWDRRGFVANWWRIYAGDSYWVPPYYPTLRRALTPIYNSHLARMPHFLVHVEALSRRGRGSQVAGHLAAPKLEMPVAATVAVCDSRRPDGAAYLALLQCANDVDSLKRLLEYLAELLRPKGYRKLIGPTGLSPHLGSGLLQDYWADVSPLHTPYNPPYMPEVVDQVLQPLTRSQLYHLDIPPELPSSPSSPARLRPFEPAHLTTDLLPLFAAACPEGAGFPAPDAKEAAFLMRWLGWGPLVGWLAELEDQPVGFILLQPDLAARLRRAKGGRNPLGRSWFAWASRKATGRGRVLYAAVLPPWRARGIGRQLLHQALLTAQQQGWQSLSIGPIPDSTPATTFLQQHGAQPRQSYLLYQQNL